MCCFRLVLVTFGGPSQARKAWTFFRMFGAENPYWKGWFSTAMFEAKSNGRFLPLWFFKESLGTKHQIVIFCDIRMWAPQTIAKLVNISPITMVCYTYNQLVNGVNLNQRSHHVWGRHIVDVVKALANKAMNQLEVYPLVICHIAMENEPFSSMIYLFKMVIFYSFVNDYQRGPNSINFYCGQVHMLVYHRMKEDGPMVSPTIFARYPSGIPQVSIVGRLARSIGKTTCGASGRCPFTTSNMAGGFKVDYVQSLLGMVNHIYVRVCIYI